MINCQPIQIEAHGIRLEPMTVDHADAIRIAASDGQLWELWFTTIPKPDDVGAYIATALAGQVAGHMLPWIVRELSTNTIVGSTRYHDIIPAADRVEIGYTWYSKSRQRTSVNTTCKLLLFTHAFETLGCKCVGLRTDNFNFASQRAIEALGAKKDGVIRHAMPRKDGTVRDSVMYSVLLHEWTDVKRHLLSRLSRHGGE